MKRRSLSQVWSSPTVAESMHPMLDLKIVFDKSSGAEQHQEPASLKLSETACLITSSSPGLQTSEFGSMCVPPDSRQLLGKQSHSGLCLRRDSLWSLSHTLGDGCLSDICVTASSMGQGRT